MGANRREFLKYSAAAGALGFLGGAVPALGEQGKETRTAQGGRRLLILGGTAFLGPQIVEAARVLGYTVTLFNRGKTHPEMFPDLLKLRGDRDGNLKALEGRKWDVVVDTSGYVPRHVRDSVTLLKDAAKQYIFISTISVYSDNTRAGMDESSPVGKLEDETTEKVTGETYGPLKALSEQAALKAAPGQVAVIRPGLIVGPGDGSDRFTYWPVRVERGGEVLAPGAPADRVQLIDVRDLAQWTMRVAEDGITGVFNATGPKEELGIGRLLDTCRSVSGSNASFTWVDASFLEEQKVAPWADMPVWVPPTGDTAGFARVSCARAIARGLAFRPLATTVRDTLAWWKSQPKERQAALRAGIKPDREVEVLKAWRERKPPVR